MGISRTGRIAVSNDDEFPVNDMNMHPDLRISWVKYRVLHI